MDLIIAESFIKKVFDDFIDDCDLNSAGIIIYEFQAKFNYNILDIYEILYKCPMLLKH